MKELKFRAWCKPRKEMLDIQRISFKNNKILPYGWNINWDGEQFEVMQYTGLKDKNGKEIYEGDIVRCWGGEYCQGYWELDNKAVINNMINDCFMMDEYEFIEVIGNIYENPDLLKKLKKSSAKDLIERVI